MDSKLDVVILSGGPDKIKTGSSLALIDINGKTILQRQLDSLLELSIGQIAITTSHQSSDIIYYCHNRLALHPYSANLKIFVEKNPRGTGGAVKYALEKIGGNNPALVMNADTLHEYSMKEFSSNYDEGLESLIMAENPYGISCDYLDMDNKKNFISISKNKTDWMNAGVYIFSRSIIRYMPKSDRFSLEKELLPKILNAKIFINSGKSVNIESLKDIKVAKEIFR